MLQRCKSSFQSSNCKQCKENCEQAGLCWEVKGTSHRWDSIVLHLHWFIQTLKFNGGWIWYCLHRTKQENMKAPQSAAAPSTAHSVERSQWKLHQEPRAIVSQILSIVSRGLSNSGSWLTSPWALWHYDVPGCAPGFTVFTAWGFLAWGLEVGLPTGDWGGGDLEIWFRNQNADWNQQNLRAENEQRKSKSGFYLKFNCGFPETEVPQKKDGL